MAGLCTVSHPTPLTDALSVQIVERLHEFNVAESFAELCNFSRTLERDCLTLALRLYGEDQASFAQETAEVMDRWRPRINALCDFHDDKPSERADMAVSTQPGDLDHRGRTLRPGR